ncbi:hypothetical protein N431DRAFT_402570 [Stipitochalara longipes BDJ]|nr:hypothetical protein N431DRAFT_402570 [Stipitochalara longipes BDJ]
MSTHKAEEDPNGSPPALPPALPLDIWTLVGEQIRSRTTLQALVLVSRAFRDVFTPVLHANCSVVLSQCPAHTLGVRRKPLPSFLEHTKHFEIVFHEFCEAKLDYKIRDNPKFAAFIARMLRKMHNLQSFQWLDVSFEDSYGLSLILKDTVVVKALKNCKTLKNVSIQFSSQYLEDRPAASNCWMPLKCFQNLTSLELFSFYAFRNKVQLIKDIASLLCRCPGLKTLGLGMACDFDCDDLPESLIITDDCFLEELCMFYESNGNAPPLALETLRLGHGMYLFGSLLSTNNDFLSKLVKFSGLKTLHIFNDFIKYGNEAEDRESMEIYWSLLNGCDSLHQLAISRLEPDVTDWLNSKGQSVQELIVTHHYTMYDDDLDEFDRLNLPNLTMLFASEGTVAKRDDDGIWTDTDSSDEDLTDAIELGLDSSDSGSSGGNPEENDSSDIESSGSNESNSQSLPRNYDRSVITVLDRLHDGGAQLKELRICLDFESQWLHFYSNLPNLASLTQLYLHSRSWRSGQYPTKQSSLWPNVTKPKDIAYHYAQLIRSRCPRLQFIRIQYWAWRICLVADASTCGEEQKELVALDIDEILSIDLFAIENFPHQAGLPGHEEPRDAEDPSEQPYTLDSEVSKMIDDEARRLAADLRESGV